MVKSTNVTARDDQREVNNLPKLHEDQQQGRMLVIDEANDARELLSVARDIFSLDRLQKTDLSKAVDNLVRELNQIIVRRIEASASDYAQRRIDSGELETFSEMEAEVEYRALAISRLSEVLKRSR